MQGDNIRRLSGLEYLAELLTRADVRQPGRTFWIMPNPESASRNLLWLHRQGIEVFSEDVYLAPLYQNVIEDEVLLQAVRERRPAHIVIALGGGTQEKLGLYLKRNLKPVPAIHCIGAAIAFPQRRPGSDSPWADRLFRMALPLHLRAPPLRAQILVRTQAHRTHAALPPAAAGGQGMKEVWRARRNHETS